MLNCPFCGSADLTIDGADAGHLIVTCGSCHAHAPQASWDRRHTFFADVAEFNRKFGLPVYSDGKPELPAPDVVLYRLGFELEELTETVRALYRNDLPGVLDGLVDLAYVVLGAAHFYHLPFDEAWREVHRANMAKERGEPNDARSARGHRFDVVKPEGWEPPRIAELIDAHALVP